MDLLNSFAGGTIGTPVSTMNSGGASGDALDDVTVTIGSTMEYDNTHAVGAMAVRHRVAAGGDAHYTWETPVPPEGRWYGRVYVWFDSYPSGIARIVRGQESRALRLAIDVTSSGKVRVVDSANNQILVTSAAISRSTWVRLEWAVDHGMGTVELRLYNDASSSTPSAVATSSAGRSIGDLVTGVQFGAVGASGHREYVLDRRAGTVRRLLPRAGRVAAYPHEGGPLGSALVGPVDSARARVFATRSRPR